MTAPVCDTTPNTISCYTTPLDSTIPAQPATLCRGLGWRVPFLGGRGETEEAGVTLEDYLKTLRRWWPFVVLMPLLGALGGFGMAQLATPVYQAKASVFVTIDTVGNVQSNLTAQQRMDGFAALASSPAVLDAAAMDLASEVPGPISGVSAAVTPATTVLVVTAQADEAQKAARTADAVAQAAAREIESRGSSEVVVATTKDGREQTARVIVNADVAAEAGQSATLISPRRTANTVLGFMLGLLIGVGVPLVIQSLNPRIREPQDLEASPDVPYLGRIRINGAELDDAGREDLMLVNAALTARTDSELHRSVVLAAVEESRATAAVAAGLARELASDEVPVALVQAGSQLRAGTEPPGGVERIAVPESVDGLFDQGETRKALDVLQQRYRWVIIDAPAYKDSPEALLLATAADGVIVLVAAGTSVKAVSDAIAALRRTGSEVLGTVLL